MKRIVIAVLVVIMGAALAWLLWPRPEPSPDQIEVKWRGKPMFVRSQTAVANDSARPAPRP